MIADQRRPAAYSATAFICWSDSLAAIMRIIFFRIVAALAGTELLQLVFGVFGILAGQCRYWPAGRRGRAVAACTGRNALLEIAHAPQLLAFGNQLLVLATAGVSFCWLK